MAIISAKKSAGTRRDCRHCAMNPWWSLRWRSTTDLTGNEYSCESLAKNIQLTQKVLSKGDRAIALERIAKSGKSITELVEAYRKTNPELFK
ncbi:MAG: hypothetical protein IPP88_04995 [Betaproteobacteria bacterium]|nr:hypothetical protein [Betaproteobacteria bacterium]